MTQARVPGPMEKPSSLARAIARLFIVLTLGLPIILWFAHAAEVSPAKKAAAETQATSPGATNAIPPATKTDTDTASKGGNGTSAEVIKIGIGDRLSFKIVEDQEEARVALVSDSGEIDFPYIGRIRAQDKTSEQLTAEIKQKLEQEYYYTATVILSVDQFNRGRRKVYLSGYFRSAGPLDLPSDEVVTLSKAVLRAGGFQDFADKKRVRLTRSGGTNAVQNKVFYIDVGSIIDEGKTELDMVLESGDLIYVPAKLFRF